MKRLLFVMLLISSISYSSYSFSSDRDNKRKREEICSFTPFKTYQEFLEEQKTRDKEVRECYKAYDQWYNQWLENNESFVYQEYLKKPHPAKREFEKHLPEGLRKDIGNIVQGYLYVDFKQWQENNEKLLDYAEKGNIKSIQELLESGDVNINTQNQYGYTALIKAVSNNNKELVKLLLEKGSNVNIQNRNGSTVLMDAVWSKNKEIIKFLLQAGANINVQNRYGCTALMMAVHLGNKEIVELLLEKGANVNTQDHDGETALMKAVNTINPNIELIELLLEKGANVNIQDQHGDTALIIAKRLGISSLIKNLKS